MKLSVKVIFVDLDGTIVDSKGAYLEATRAGLAAIGKEMTNIKIVNEIPKRIEQNLPIDSIVGETEVPRFLQAYLGAYYRATAEKGKPMPEVSDTLRQLSQKARLALITMRRVPHETVLLELQKHGLAKYFQIIMTALDTHSPKPSPESLIECAKLLQVQTCECLVVGDSVADIRAGKNAGAKTVAVLSGIYSRSELQSEKPDLILESVNELPGFLE
jgi:HAD superfamily hydrolase (TIGR01549 family)